MRRHLSFFDEIYISPHLDDAIYSCSERIKESTNQKKKVLIVTVFTKCNHESIRKAEDLIACTNFNCEWMHLNFKDSGMYTKFQKSKQFLFGRHDSGEIYDRLIHLIQLHSTSDTKVLFPLSIGFHPDHSCIFKIGLNFLWNQSRNILFYEDFPYKLNESNREFLFQYYNIQPEHSSGSIDSNTKISKDWCGYLNKKKSFTLLFSIFLFVCWNSLKRSIVSFFIRKPAYRCKVHSKLTVTSPKKLNLIQSVYPSQFEDIFTPNLIEKINSQYHLKEIYWKIELN